jgi:hypothetical protein
LSEKAVIIDNLTNDENLKIYNTAEGENDETQIYNFQGS